MKFSNYIGSVIHALRSGRFFPRKVSEDKGDCLFDKQPIEEDKSVRYLKSLLIAHLNHEVRTPLTAILGFSELLLLESPEKKELCKDYYKYIVRSCDQLLSSFEHVQELCEVESGLRQLDKGAVDLEVLCFEVSFQYRHLTAYGVNLEVCADSQPLSVFADAYLLKRLYVHLLDNAVRCTKQGYIVLSHYYLAENSLLNICVSDTGCGISAQDQERIFNPFEKTGTYSPGFGLGLTICKAIAQSMGGWIRVESEKKKGTLFVVSIPCQRVV